MRERCTSALQNIVHALGVWVERIETYFRSSLRVFDTKSPQLSPISAVVLYSACNCVVLMAMLAGQLCSDTSSTCVC
jgi:hypothetical protein